MKVRDLIEYLEDVNPDTEVEIQYYDLDAAGGVTDSIKAIALDYEQPKCILMAHRDWS